MFTTFLFDLDGTLVPMDMEEFIAAYFQAVASKFARIIDPDKLVKGIWESTMAMVNNLDPQKTNKEIFWSHFSPRIGLPSDVLVGLFDEFYANDFPNIKRVARPNPLARPLLEQLIRNGHRVVIATNPIFPENAIRERLNWVDIGDLPYELITAYENMHFCKPRIEYYEEILACLNVRPEECLMVGNDVEEDLICRKLGIKTFLVEDWLLNPKNLPIETDYRGSFKELADFLCDLVKP
ncbi:MAG: HAD family hydrolase [Thermacetogeniaceae bacterium]